MSEWERRPISAGALVSAGCWTLGAFLVLGAVFLPAIPTHWAPIGQMMFSIGCVRTVLAVLASHERRVAEAFNLGRQSAKLHVMRE